MTSNVNPKASTTMTKVLTAIAKNNDERSGNTSGRKMFQFLLTVMEFVSRLPPQQNSLPKVNGQLLRVIGSRCAAEPDLRKSYPDVAGMVIHALLDTREITHMRVDVLQSEIARSSLFSIFRSSIPFELGDSEPIPAATRDRRALLLLHEATDGGEWRINDWSTSKPIKKWHGVKTNAEGRVVKLELEHHNMTGALFADR